MGYTLFYSKDAKDDYKKIVHSIYKNKIDEILAILSIDPYQNPPPFKKLVGISDELYSRRINLQHRLLYQVDKATKKVKILSMCGHYGDN